jgi:hypothetical protein
MKDLASYEALPMEQLRDGAMDDLVRHYSLERLTIEEFERRSEIVAKATTKGEILSTLADLPSPAAGGASRAPGRARSGAPATWSVASGGVRPNDVAIAIFGGSDMKGVWRAPRRLASLSVFGGTNIDLRKAIVPEEGITISCICAFGGADIIVPPGMRVLTRGFGVFGGFDRTNNEPEDSSAPTVIVEGIAVFGGVSVKIRD